MTTEEIVKHLVKECGLSFTEVRDLTDHQIAKILLLPDRTDKGG